MENFKNSTNIHLLFVSEIRTMQGDSHVFKTSSRQYQVRWIRAISEEIVKNNENIFTEMAELIISDEQEARSRYAEEVTCDFLKVTKSPRHRGNYLWSMTGHGGETVNLTRFKMLVNEYK